MNSWNFVIFLYLKYNNMELPKKKNNNNLMYKLLESIIRCRNLVSWDLLNVGKFKLKGKQKKNRSSGL